MAPRSEESKPVAAEELDKRLVGGSGNRPEEPCFESREAVWREQGERTGQLVDLRSELGLVGAGEESSEPSPVAWLEIAFERGDGGRTQDLVELLGAAA